MPWRLIQFIVIFAIFLVFTGFNLANKCNISFGFKELTDVPVYLTAFTTFILGMLCALPFIIKVRSKKKKGAPENNAEGTGKPPRSRGKKKIEPLDMQEDSSFSDGGPYGVN